MAGLSKQATVCRIYRGMIFVWRLAWTIVSYGISMCTLIVQLQIYKLAVLSSLSDLVHVPIQSYTDVHSHIPTAPIPATIMIKAFNTSS